jgi:hypothetical protein
MLRNKVLILFFQFIWLFTGCITPFEPDIKPAEMNKYAVAGEVTDISEIQTITVSRTSSVNDPEFIPVDGCDAVINDDAGNEFPMQEYEKGTYRCMIHRSFLVPGASFRIKISAPDGTVIESDYDTINECPEVGSVYYLRKNITSGSNETKGIQFYVDLKAEDLKSRYFKWALTETWEYHVPYPREWYYDGRIHHISPPDYSRSICWKTASVRDIFTLSTIGLSENRYDMFPLNFINNKSPQLVYGYSLLINQYSMSEAAYSYWDQLQVNSTEQGGLYEKQPFTVTGNMHNLTDPAREVLGYFGAYSVKSKRIFVKDVEDLEIEYIPICTPMILLKGLIELSPDDYPAFLYGDKYGFELIYLGSECVDCLSLGGINIKPEFWPW